MGPREEERRLRSSWWSSESSDNETILLLRLINLNPKVVICLCLLLTPNRYLKQYLEERWWGKLLAFSGKARAILFTSVKFHVNFCLILNFSGPAFHSLTRSFGCCLLFGSQRRDVQSYVIYGCFLPVPSLFVYQSLINVFVRFLGGGGVFSFLRASCVRFPLWRLR